MCARPVGSYWVAHCRLALAISDGTDGSAPDAVPRSLAKPGSSSRTLHASSECSHPEPAPALASRRKLGTRAQRARGVASLGVAFPLRDVSQRHRCGEVPTPPPSALGVSHALDGFIRYRPCGFISPRCHVQGSTLQGFPLPAQPNRLVAGPCPHVGWLWSPANGCPPAPASGAPPSGL